MGVLFIYILLLVLVIASISTLKAYKSVPLKELRRRARKGNKAESSYYKVANYGRSADILLWVLISLGSAGLVIRLSGDLNTWLAFGLVFIFVVTFFWLAPSRQVSVINQKMAILFSPIFAKLLSILMPILKWLELKLDKFVPINFHNGVYEKEDLIELLESQKTQPGNRLTEQELTIAINSLSFSDKIVRDVMTPKRVMKSLMASDQISPHILDEIHSSGFSRIPVYEKDEEGREKVVGILYTKDLIDAVHAGSVGGVMDKKVYYVQEELDLGHVLSAFLKTKHHLYVVVNNFEEVVGVISIEDVLEQVIGVKIVDEFDSFDDLRAVAGLEAKKDKKSNNHAVEPAKPEQTDEIVVE